MLPTGFVYSDEYLRHDPGAGHPERPERLQAIAQFTDITRWLSPVVLGQTDESK